MPLTEPRIVREMRNGYAGSLRCCAEARGSDGGSAAGNSRCWEGNPSRAQGVQEPARNRRAAGDAAQRGAEHHAKHTQQEAGVISRDVFTYSRTSPTTWHLCKSWQFIFLTRGRRISIKRKKTLVKVMSLLCCHKLQHA